MVLLHILGVLLVLIVGCNAKTLTNVSIINDPIPEITTENYRLKPDVFPKHYSIELRVRADFYRAKSFSGSVKIGICIGLNSTETDKEIILNAKNLNVTYTTLYELNKPEKNLLNLSNPYYTVPKLDRVVLRLSEEGMLNETCSYVIGINYNGNLQDEMHGFYLSSYKNKNNQNEWLATTQFEAIYAREAFPCFDEPIFKATFDIKIIHPQEYYVLSNEDVIVRESVGEGMYQTSFKQSPLMSTYLVAFTMSKFANLSEPNIEVGKNSIWSRSTFINQGQYSLNIAPKIIKELNELTNISYTTFISKLDQIAIPDLMAEAMENWGLVTYREPMLLWDEESNTRSKQSVTTVIAHELAHMWFGNLVTLKWWSSAWINEGFAQYFEYFATHKVESHWELDKQFVVEQHQMVLNDDSLLASHPLTLEEDKVLTLNNITNRFDSITYAKGASIIRMMKHFIGEEDFTVGIRRYLAHNQEKNTEPKDVWNAFQYNVETLESEPVTLETIMKTWTEQAGFPVVFVEIEETKTTNIILTQIYLVFKDDSEEVITEPAAWYVPISFTTSETRNFSKAGPDFWLQPKDKNYTLENVIANESSWIVLNIQSSAFIRINYSKQLWKSLEHALKRPDFDGIHVINRAQIVDDSMNLARAGEIPYATAFDIGLYLENETDYYPWYSAFKAFEYLKLRFDHAARVTALLNVHIKNLMQELYNNVRRNDKPTHIDTLKKVLALSWACELNNENCVKDAEQLYRSFRDNNTRIEPDLRKIVYCTALRKSKNNEDWEFLKGRLSETHALSEISTIISALGCTRNVDTLNRYLEYSINPALEIRKQDAQSIFNAVVSGGPDGPPIAFAFLQNKLESIKQSYGGIGGLSSILITLSEHLRDETQIRTFEKFINTTDLGEANETVNNAIERCMENIEWVRRYSSDIQKYLEKIVIIPTTTTTKRTTTIETTSIETTTISSSESTPTSTVAYTTTEDSNRASL
ncbi:hypothetical protein ILUMI_12018, partial [Ignelater luminosus]